MKFLLRRNNREAIILLQEQNRTKHVNVSCAASIVANATVSETVINADDDDEGSSNNNSNNRNNNNSNNNRSNNNDALRRLDDGRQQRQDDDANDASQREVSSTTPSLQPQNNNKLRNFLLRHLLSKVVMIGARQTRKRKNHRSNNNQTITTTSTRTTTRTTKRAAEMEARQMVNLIISRQPPQTLYPSEMEVAEMFRDGQEISDNNGDESIMDGEVVFVESYEHAAAAEATVTTTTMAGREKKDLMKHRFVWEGTRVRFTEHGENDVDANPEDLTHAAAHPLNSVYPELCNQLFELDSGLLHARAVLTTDAGDNRADNNEEASFQDIVYADVVIDASSDDAESSFEGTTTEKDGLYNNNNEVVRPGAVRVPGRHATRNDDDDDDDDDIDDEYRHNMRCEVSPGAVWVPGPHPSRNDDDHIDDDENRHNIRYASLNQDDPGEWEGGLERLLRSRVFREKFEKPFMVVDNYVDDDEMLLDAEVMLAESKLSANGDDSCSRHHDDVLWRSAPHQGEHSKTPRQSEIDLCVVHGSEEEFSVDWRNALQRTKSFYVPNQLDHEKDEEGSSHVPLGNPQYATSRQLVQNSSSAHNQASSLLNNDGKLVNFSPFFECQPGYPITKSTVCFEWHNNPATIKWKEVVRQYSRAYCHWDDLIFERVMEELAEEDYNRFLVFLNARGEPCVTIHDGLWFVATEKEILEKTKQQFLCDRSDLYGMDQHQLQGSHDEQPFRHGGWIDGSSFPTSPPEDDHVGTSSASSSSYTSSSSLSPSLSTSSSWSSSWSSTSSPKPLSNESSLSPDETANVAHSVNQKCSPTAELPFGPNGTLSDLAIAEKQSESASDQEDKIIPKLDASAHLDSNEETGCCEEHVLANYKGNETNATSLLHHQPGTHSEENCERTPPHVITLRGPEAIIGLSFHQHVNPNAKTRDAGWPPMHSAILNSEDDIVALFLKYHTNPNEQIDNVDTPLHLAVEMGNEAIVSLLLQHQAKPNDRNRNGDIPLHLAAKIGHEAIVALLLQHQSDPNAITRTDGWTPLHYACRYGMNSVASLLLQHQSDPNATDKFNRTPLHLASNHGDEDIVSLLLHHNADPNAQDTNGSTPLQMAAENGLYEVAALLLHHRTKQNDDDESGRTSVADTCTVSRFKEKEDGAYCLKNNSFAMREITIDWCSQWDDAISVLGMEALLEDDGDIFFETSHSDSCLLPRKRSLKDDPAKPK